jgi:hypothetical protein
MHAGSIQNVPTRKLCCRGKRDRTGGLTVGGSEFTIDVDPTRGGSFEDLACGLSSRDAPPQKINNVVQMMTSIAAKLQASAANSQEAGANTVDWLHDNGRSWKDAAEMIAMNLEGLDTIVHHGGSDHKLVEAAFQEVRQVDCVARVPQHPLLFWKQF